ncbi:MAG TPA: hypothetical protein PKK99_11280, partial [Bacteroidia bacterium]|nr:hypothetical protein [Bacteroidia bacterium]
MKKYLLIACLFITHSVHSQLSWIKKADFPGNGKTGVSSFSINNKGYMGLGLDSLSNGSTDWYEYDEISNSWTQMSSLPGIGRWTCTSFVINGKGYIVCGATNFSNVSETWEFDPIANSWIQKSHFPGIERQNAAGFSINGKGYVGTGYNGGVSFDDFYEFDPVLNTWTQKSDFAGSERNTAAGFSVGGFGYIGMGCATNSLPNYNDLYEYDPIANSWTRKADFPLPSLDAPTCCVSNTDAYVLCGYYYQYQDIEHNPMNLVYQYNPQNDNWRLLGTFPGLPRGYAGGFALSNDIYIGGGGNNNFTINTSTQISDFWKLADGLTLRIGSVKNPVLSILPNPAQ